MVAAAVAAATATVLAPSVAAAAPPVVESEGEFNDEFVDEFLCEQGPITIAESGWFVEKSYYNKDGTLQKSTFRIRGTTEWSSAFAEATEHWAWNGTYDPEADTFTDRGNQWNVHVVGDGVVLNNSGLLKFTFGEDGPEILKAAGPKDVYPFEPPFAMCDVLFP